MRIITVKPNQNLLDIAIQEYGDITGVYALLDDNPRITGVTHQIYVGDELSIRDAPLNVRMQNYLDGYDIGTATEYRQGIGYWEIGVNFKIG